MHSKINKLLIQNKKSLEGYLNNIGKEINLIASRKCDGQILCSAFEIRIKITHEGKFAYLKNKDFIIKSKNQRFDCKLNNLQRT